MKHLLIAAIALASLTANAQDKNKDKKQDKTAIDSVEWVITPDGKDTLALKMKGKDPVIKDPAKLTNFYWQTRQERDLFLKKLQYADYAFRLINLQGEIVDPKTFFKVLEGYREVQ
ncbi:MAG: hypothetical protein KAF40_00275 [Flavihumibacter sp.]|nr:hypothetical protein [Flavihumibacter sp.]